MLNNSLNKIFESNAKTFNNKIALLGRNFSWTYEQFLQCSQVVSSHISKMNYLNKPIGIITTREPETYANIQGIFRSGNYYVPLNPKFPIDRNINIIKQSNLKLILIPPAATDLADEIKKTLPDISLLIHSKDQSKNENSIDYDVQIAPPSTASELAYIIFTSGSSGTPKGVQISQSNVIAYTKNIKKYVPDLSSDDIFSQIADLTFDMSVHDIMLPWALGATLAIVPDNELFAPIKFVNDMQVTAWMSVPSVLSVCKKLKLLKSDSIQSIKHSFFCGEPLKVEDLKSWMQACTNSSFYNVYGPTEATVAISLYQIDNIESIKSKNNVVSIGKVFDDQKFKLLNDELESCTEGVLYLAGSQVSKGYFNLPEKNEYSFIGLNKDSSAWYRTGDIVELINGELYFVSREDFQTKIRGYRVELQEIDSFITAYNSKFSAVSVAINDSIYTFVQITDNTSLHDSELKKYLKNNLPEYMIPKKFIVLDSFPTNINGKVDRKQLMGLI